MWLQTQDDDMFAKFASLFAKDMRGKTLKTRVPERPLFGVSAQTILDIQEIIGTHIMETK